MRNEPLSPALSPEYREEGGRSLKAISVLSRWLVPGLLRRQRHGSRSIGGGRVERDVVDAPRRHRRRRGVRAAEECSHAYADGGIDGAGGDVGPGASRE